MKAKYITPVVTVMDKEGNPDMEGCGKVYEHLIQGGVDGILLMGSIGEFFALTMSQKKELIRYAVHKINHRTQLIVGTTSMIVDEIIELSRFAKQEGADAVIILPPYYFPLEKKAWKITLECWRKPFQISPFISIIFRIAPAMTSRRKLRFAW